MLLWVTQGRSKKDANGSPNWDNRTLFHGDNLPVLRGMNSNTVDLIATDPPFNKGRDFHATPNSLATGAKFQDRWSWEQDVHQEWIDQIMDESPQLMEAIESARYAHSDGMGAYMCFMAVRLLDMHRILKPTGSLYLHCDPTASHYLKNIMDAIFGRKNFRNEIVWKRTNAPTASPNQFGFVHDKMLFYSKTARTKLHPIFIPYTQEYIDKHYRHCDPRGRFHPAPLSAQGTRQGDSGNPWRGIDITAKGSHWVCPTALPDGMRLPVTWGHMTTQVKLDWLDANGLIYRPSRGTMPRFKRYLSTVEGTRASDVMTDIPAVMGSSREKTGYPTQKPLALYERIITASSNEGDVVLDPFAGCATTLVAAERLQRHWVGIDIWEGAYRLVTERLRDTTGLLGTVNFTARAPERTDDGEEASPFLRVKERVNEPGGPRWSRAQMYEYLLNQNGPQCQGCDRTFDDSRYLELDHNTPASDGGGRHISNRILLCGPCNRLQSNSLTLSGLRKENKKQGFLVQTTTRRTIDGPTKPRTEEK